MPGFLHIPAPYPYRYSGDVRDGETIGQAAARALEEAILREGPETVGAFIAEPVQGAGGVIVPPEDYFPLVRRICDKYDVLLIADEVITGFGRTGEWFGLGRYGIEPDIMSFAKGVTSGYLPLGGIQISDKIRDVIMNAPADQTWMHAYTYSAHPTCTAVGLKNVQLMREMDLADRAAVMGRRLLEGLQGLAEEFPAIGDVRGLGLICAVELVADRDTKQPSGTGAKVRACRHRARPLHPRHRRHHRLRAAADHQRGRGRPDGGDHRASHRRGAGLAALGEEPSSPPFKRNPPG